MKLSDVREILSASVMCGEERLSEEVLSVCGSDLMSDVLAFVKDQSVLLTGLMNQQVVRTAEMMDMKCIVFVRGKTPEPDVVTLANQRGLTVMSTMHRMYEACGRLYSGGLV
ncbi:MAG: DRTGG domain-containing protein [Oscillospiraceae bacterium]|nr:DRTGG domain-containing protein [Oscillospiraceae bacterium]